MMCGMTTISGPCRALTSLVLGLGLALTATGCERACGGDDYPVRNDAGGSACVPAGEEPPPGFERYPPGQTPTYADEMG